LSCLVKELREKVESGVNKRKGKLVRLRGPKDIPEEVWVKTHKYGTILEEAYVVYRSKANPQITWEVSVQAIGLRDGCVGLRVVEYREGGMGRVPIITYSWVLEDLKPEISRTTIIRDMLRKSAIP